MSEQKTILAFGGHMDDPELGCGGTLLKAARNGHRVVCCVICGKFFNFRSLDGQTPEDLVAKNQAIMEKYGFEPKRFLDYSYMEIQEDLSAKRVFSELIQEIKPDVVFAHTVHDRWSDHRVSGQVLEHAGMFSHLYLDVEFHRPELYFYETSFSQVYADRFRPDVFIDISDVVDEAMEMMTPHDAILQRRFGPEPPVHAEIELKHPKECRMTLTRHGLMKFARCYMRGGQARIEGFVEAFESLYPTPQDDRVLYRMVEPQGGKA